MMPPRTMTKAPPEGKAASGAISDPIPRAIDADGDHHMGGVANSVRSEEFKPLSSKASYAVARVCSVSASKRCMLVKSYANSISPPGRAAVRGSTLAMKSRPSLTR